MANNRILLVDDQPLVLSAIAHYLSQHGYEIHTAVNGKDGLAKAEAVKPDLVIADVLMPVMNGWELVRSLRANPKFTLLPVIILTDQDTPESRMQGFKLGADDFVSKTTLVQELEVRIARALERGAAIARAIGDGGAAPASALPPPASPVPASPPAEPEPTGAGFDLPPLAQAMSQPSAPSPEPPTRPSAPEASAGSPGIQGSLDEIGLASVLTLIGSGQQSGVLTLTENQGRQKARMLIRGGQLLKIAVDDNTALSPTQAIAHVMRWREASFAFSHQDVTAHDEIQSSIEHLLMEASQLLDESAGPIGT